MVGKLLHLRNVQTIAIVYVMIAASLVFIMQAHTAAAAGTRTNLLIGLQQDMPNLDYFDVATNTIWKGYQLQFNWEPLLTFDPDYAIYADLADPARGGAACPAGSVGQPGFCIDSTGLNLTVYVRSGMTFTDGVAMNADDVVFSFQTLGWSTYANGIAKGIWWSQPKFDAWNSSAYGGTCAAPSGLPYACKSHVGITKIDATTVKFTFTPHALPGGITGGYSLALYDTLNTPIIPAHVWKTHMLASGLANYSDPTGGAVSDTWDRSIDTTYGAGMTQVDATIGTGPFMLTAWTRNAGSTLQVYTNYWGKSVAHAWKGTSYGFYPAYLQSINFVVYGSLDVVSLALQKGEIDTMLWPVLPGFLNQINSNPSITSYLSQDSGFFYLSFNLNKPPWNQKILREAISMAIDKDYILNTLLGGFGVKGTVPISSLNLNYFNTSASPPSFDVSGGRALLLANGYTLDSSGFFKDPNGNPIKASILTPPKDYDPVRADAGIMISNNLKRMGLDIDAAPTSFNTIVAKFQVAPITYDIYILGWSLSPFPEAYICTFFCSDQATNINPSGSNTAQLNDPVVDAKIAQALYTLDAAKRYQLVKDVEGLVVNDLGWNVLYYRKNLGAYRNDVFGGWTNFPPISSASFGIFNFFTLVNLRPAGAGITPGPSGALSVATSMPDQVYYRENVPIETFVSQNSAPVANAAVTVNITFGTYTARLTGTTDSLGHASFTWTVPLLQGSGVVTTTATSGTVTGTNQKIMEATIGPPLPSAQLALNTTRPVIRPGGQAVITAKVTNSAGTGLAGITVKIDSTLLLGNVTPWQGAATNANGVALFTYKAPADASKFPNQHLIDIVKANVSVGTTIAGDTQRASIVMVVQNDLAPNWNITAVQSATPGFVIGTPPRAPTTVITVHVTNFTGASQAGIKVDALSSDTNNITVAPSTSGSDTTNPAGIASFTVTEKTAALTAMNGTNVVLKFQPHGNAFATSDSVLLLVSNGTAGYAAQVTLANRVLPYNPTPQTDGVSVRVWNQNGLVAANVPAIFHIDYGPFGPPAQFPFSMDYGIPDPVTGAWSSSNPLVYPPSYTTVNGNLDATILGGGSIGGSFRSSVGQGAAYGVENVVEDFEVVNDGPNLATGNTIDSCDPTTFPAHFSGTYFVNATSKTDSMGFYNSSFYIDHEKLDSPIQVQAFIGAVAGKTPHLEVSPCTPATTFNDFVGSLDSGLVTQRAPIFALGQVIMTAPGKSTLKPIVTSQSTSVELHAHFYGVDGSVVSKPSVFLTQGASSAGRNVKGAFGGTMILTDLADPRLVTGARNDTGWRAGWVNYTRLVCATAACTATSPQISLSQALTFNYVPADTRYAYSGREQLIGLDYGDYWFSPATEVLNAKLPFTVTTAYLYLPTTTAFLTVSLAQTLLPASGSTTATVTVWSSLTGAPISGASVWSGSTQVTTDANGVATVSTSALTLGATEGLVVATTPYGGTARGWFAYVASNPVLTYSNLVVTQAVTGSASTVTVSVQNTLPVAGNTTVWLTIDGANTVAQVVSIGASASKTLTFSYVFTTTGSHTVAVGSQSTTVSIAAPPAPDMTTAYVLAIGLLVAGLVVGTVVGIVLTRRRKKPPTSAMGPEMSEESPKAAEELGPDENL